MLEDGKTGTFIVHRLLVVGGCRLRLFRLRVVVTVRVIEIAAAVTESTYVIPESIAVAVVAETILTSAVVMAEVAATLIARDGDNESMAIRGNARTAHSNSTTAFIEIDSARDADLRF